MIAPNIKYYFGYIFYESKEGFFPSERLFVIAKGSIFQIKSVGGSRITIFTCQRLDKENYLNFFKENEIEFVSNNLDKAKKFLMLK